ncbi:MAG TPA: guanylate kinase [Chloroflexota bacterium]
MPTATPTPKGLLFVLSGPSGVGKDSVMERLRRTGDGLHFCVTATTRRKRPGEVEGVDYFFYSRERFEQLLQRDELLEWAVVHDNLYGIPMDQVRQGLRAGRDVIVRIDVQGAATVRRKLPNAVLIFLAPASLEELLDRMRARGTETEEEVAARMAIAAREMAALPSFDYVVVNRDGRLDETVQQVRCIITAERSRVTPRRVEL